MKFTLANNGKITKLTEQFILLEASQADVQNYCTEIIKIIKPLFNAELNDANNVKQNSNIINELILKTKNFANDCFGPITGKAADPMIIKGSARKYVEAVKELLKKLGKVNDSGEISDADFVKIFKPITDVISSSKIDKDTINALKGAIQSTNTILNSWLKSITTKSIGSTTLEQGEIKGTLQAIYADLRVVSNLIKNKPELYVETFGQSVSSIYQAAKNYATSKTDKELADLLSICKQEHDGPFGKELAQLAKEQGLDDKRAVVRNEVARGTDWDKKYQEAKNKPVFWKDYFYTVWGDKSKQVEALGEAFKQECEKLGFNETSNPFIRYLKEYLVKQNFNITKEPYAAIHNAVVSGRAIGQNRLVKDQYPVQDSGWDLSPIHKASFFTKSLDDIKMYFDVLETCRNLNNIDTKNILMGAQNISEDAIKDQAVAFFTNIQGAGATNISLTAVLIYALLYTESGNFQTLTTAGKPINDSDLTNASTLRSGAEIKKLLSLMEAASGRGGGGSWSKENSNDFISALKAVYSMPALDDIKNQTAVSHYLLVIAEQLPAKPYEDLVNKYKLNDGTPLAKIALDGAARASIKKDLEKYATSMSPQTALSLIRSIISTWGLKS